MRRKKVQWLNTMRCMEVTWFDSRFFFFRETNTSYYEEDSTMKSLEDIFAELDKLNEDLLKQNEETLKSVNK